MLLTPELAQPIVDRAMAILQRNVNIMDANGVMVGSGDPARIGSFHPGAAAVMRTGRRVEIQPEDLPNWGGVRMGVNLPLRLDGQIVGVVGITGLPDEVRPFGELIREMVQLMLAQARTAELERTSALARESLLRDLLTGAGPLSDRMTREAAILGLKEATPYIVLVVEPPEQAEPGDYAWLSSTAARVEQAVGDAHLQPFLTAGPWEGRLVVVTAAAAVGLAAGLQSVLAPGAALAAGLPASGMSGLSRSYRTALLALAAGRRMRGAGAFTADELHLETLLATVPSEDAGAFIARVLGGLLPAGTRAGAAARETLEAFVGSGLSASHAAERLGVHRHTLIYRLDQLTSATGFDPRTWDGAVRLYLALILERFFGHNGQNGAS